MSTMQQCEFVYKGGPPENLSEYYFLAYLNEDSMTGYKGGNSRPHFDARISLKITSPAVWIFFCARNAHYSVKAGVNSLDSVH